jgi:hypothetical protein
MGFHSHLRAALVALGLCGISLAHAHNPLAYSSDPFGSLVVAELRPDTVELRISMVRPVGIAMAGQLPITSFDFLTRMTLTTNSTASPSGSASQTPADDADFTAVRTILLQRARDLYQVFVDGAALSPREVEVHVGSEGDIQFHLTYPRPATGALRIQAGYLTQMPAGHIDSLQVVDQTGKILATGDLTAQNPSYAVMIPAAGAASGKAGTMELAAFIVAFVIFALWRVNRTAVKEVS